MWEKALGGKQKSSVREREFPPHREVVFDQGLSRLESPTLHKHINTTQPAWGFLLLPAGQRSCNHCMWARADPGTAHPIPKGTRRDPWASRVLPPSIHHFFPAVRRPCAPRILSLAMSPVPSTAPGQQRDTGHCSKALSSLPAFPPLRLPEQPRELQAQSVTFSKSLSLLSLLPHRAGLQCWGVQEAPG